MSLRNTADGFDRLADMVKAHTREPTTGATESRLFGDLARILVMCAARLRSDADDADDNEDRRQAALAASREIREASWDPAAHSVAEVNEYLAGADETERARVLAVEAQDRPDVPVGKKQRTGVLAGPHTAYQ